MNRKLIPFLIGTASVAAVAVLWFSGIFQSLERKFYDSRIRTTAPYTKVADDIYVIEIDQESITAASERYGWGWPWPREAFGRMVDYMTEGGSGPVVLDILFTEPSVFGPEDDEAFARSIRNNGMTIIDQMSGNGTDGTVLEPLPQFIEAAAIVADCSSTKDSDGIIRGVTVTQTGTTQDGTTRELVSLSYAALLVEENAGWEYVEELDRMLPKRNDGKVLLRYKGAIDRYIPYKAIDILESIDAVEAGEEPVYDSWEFENGYVFFIYYAPGLYDICTTPISTVYPGSGVSITALDNVLLDDFIYPMDDSVTFILIIFCGLLASWFALSVSHINETGKTIVFGAVFFILGPVILFSSSWLFMLKGYDVSVVAPAFSYLTGYIAVTFYSYIAEGRQKRFIKTAFSQYLSKDVINTLLDDPSQLQLGGAKRNITVFFSDIKGFTSIGEKLPPESLTEVLNVYLTELSSIIMEAGGTIDKYVGDAIVAFWNAPATIEGHASKAVAAALKCQQKVFEMQHQLSAFVTEPLYTRIGINTGEAIVGNMGSRNRFNYTMFGDVVNTGSRLEGLNKQFGTHILCTAETKEMAEEFGTGARFREIGRVLVIGKTEPVTVYEPMTAQRWNTELPALEAFADALQLFYQGNLEKALKSFSDNAEKTGDSPSRFYKERCRQLLESAKENPAVLENWQGIWVASSK